MKILTTAAYRKLVNLCDSLSTKLYNEKTTTSLLLHENFELQKRVKELEKKLDRSHQKRDAKGLFLPKVETLAKIQATLNAPMDATVKVSGEQSKLLALLYHVTRAVL